MSQWKTQAPAALIVPSTRDSNGGSNPLSLPLHMTPLPDSLHSPVDPGFLEGASSSALFGLDIGGTLCKVVLFEPLLAADQKKLSSKGAKSKLSSTNFYEESKPTVERSLDNCIKDVENSACDAHFQHNDGRGTEARLQSEAVDVKMCECGQATPKEGDHLCKASENSAESGVTEDDRMGDSSRQARKMWVSSHDPVHLPGRGTLYFKCFETWKMEEFLTLTKEHSLVTKGRALGATGGGARKFGDLFLEIAGLQLQRADELKSLSDLKSTGVHFPIQHGDNLLSGGSNELTIHGASSAEAFVDVQVSNCVYNLVRGIDFLARHAHHESFEYPSGLYKGGVIQRPWQENSSDDGDNDRSEGESPTGPSELDNILDSTAERKGGNKGKGTVFRGPVATSGTGWLGGSKALYPYLVVNIGSGVSILRVDDADRFERVGGTSLGGRRCPKSSEHISIASNCTFLGLTSALTGCSSFEEAINLAMEGDSTQIDMLVGDIYGGDYTEMGLAATTVASSFGKLVQPGMRESALQAPQNLAKAVLLMVTNNIGSIARLHAQAAGVRHIMFTGSFLFENSLAMRLLAVAMEFWSKGNIKAVFLRHEGHAGAMGALLSTLDLENSVDALLLNST